MFKQVSLGLAAAMLAAGASAAPTVPAWLEVGDWRPAAETSVHVVLYRLEDGTGPGGGRLATVRLEAKKTGESRFGSMTGLTEFDCAAGRSRMLKSTYYEGRNLGGLIQGRGTIRAAWGESRPDRAMGKVLAEVCA